MSVAEFRRLFLIGAGFDVSKIPPTIDEETWRELSLQALAGIGGGGGATTWDQVTGKPTSFDTLLAKVSDMSDDARTFNAAADFAAMLDLLPLPDLSGYATLFDGTGGWVDSANAAIYDKNGSNDLSTLFDGTGGNVARATVLDNNSGATLEYEPINNVWYGVGSNINADYTNGGVDYLPNLFDASGGFVTRANQLDNGGGQLFYWNGVAWTADVETIDSLHITCGTIQTSSTGPDATDNGEPGQMVFTDAYTYRCFANGDWRRQAAVYTTY